MEVDRIGKPLFVSEASALDLDGLDPAVDALGGTVGDAQNDGIDYPPEVCLDHACHLFDRLEPTPDGPGIPLGPRFQRPSPAFVMPDRRCQLFDGPRPSRFVGTLTKTFKRIPFPVAHVRRKHPVKCILLS